MGGETFEVYMAGSDMEGLFREAREQAAWEHGHGGYTGTIAEKDSVERIDRRVRPREEAAALAWKLICDDDPRTEKWGPAAALAVGEEGELEGWLFFGVASS